MSTQSLPYAHLGEALATDYFQVREQFTDEQWEHFMTTRRFVDEEVLPAINAYWEGEELPWSPSSACSARTSPATAAPG
jgi:glutaryl-CoA dehydrogenase